MDVKHRCVVHYLRVVLPLINDLKVWFKIWRAKTILLRGLVALELLCPLSSYVRNIFWELPPFFSSRPSFLLSFCGLFLVAFNFDILGWPILKWRDVLAIEVRVYTERAMLLVQVQDGLTIIFSLVLIRLEQPFLLLELILFLWEKLWRLHYIFEIRGWLPKLLLKLILCGSDFLNRERRPERVVQRRALPHFQWPLVFVGTPWALGSPLVNVRFSLQSLRPMRLFELIELLWALPPVLELNETFLLVLPHLFKTVAHLRKRGCTCHVDANRARFC